MKRLIVLSPGWGKFDLGWWFMRRRFEKEGYDVIYAQYPERGLGDIESSARQVEALLEALRPNYAHITLLGHSMGGLVGRFLVQQLQRHDLIDAYISMGTPHKGTLLAYLGVFSQSASEMRPNSELLQTLDQPWPGHIPALSIQAGLDWIVYPNHSTDPGFSEHVVIKSATHSSLLVHSRSFYEAWAWLTYKIHGESGETMRHGVSSFLNKRLKKPTICRNFSKKFLTHA